MAISVRATASGAMPSGTEFTRMLSVILNGDLKSPKDSWLVMRKRFATGSQPRSRPSKKRKSKRSKEQRPFGSNGWSVT